MYIPCHRVSCVNSAIQGAVAHHRPDRALHAPWLRIDLRCVNMHAPNLLTLQKEGGKPHAPKLRKKGISRNVSTFDDIIRNPLELYVEHIYHKYIPEV